MDDICIITFVPYSPLGRGFLAGRVQKTADLAADDFRRRVPRFLGENLQKNLANLAIIQRVAEQHHLTPAQVALSWVLSKGQDMIPIPGTKRVKYLEGNLAASDVQLFVEDIRQLEGIRAYGDRYPEISMQYVPR